MISSLSIFFMMISAIISLGVPVALILIMRRKYAVSWRTFVFGALTWIIFSQILEKILHVIVFSYTDIITQPFLFVVYGALAAGVFEETGRWIIFSRFLKHERRWKDGVGFGLGHGGIEAIFIGGTAAVSLIVFSVMYNNGTFGQVTGQMPTEVAASIINTMKSFPPFFLLIGLERVLTLAVHVALSLVILDGVRKQDKRYLLIAILLHSLIDVPAAMYQIKLLPLWIVEIVVCIVAAVCFLFIIRSKCTRPEPVIHDHQVRLAHKKKQLNKKRTRHSK
jgi:uncharacterized membrane protein YhfC